MVEMYFRYFFHYKLLIITRQGVKFVLPKELHFQQTEKIYHLELERMDSAVYDVCPIVNEF